MAVHYPAPTYDYRIITSWYKLLKNESQCPTCHINGVDLQAPIEYHHLDRATKTDTISNMVYCRAPVADILTETFKVMPLCHEHHVRYHKLERYGHTDLIKSLYDFQEDSHYITAIDNFHTMAWDNAPTIMQEKFTEANFEICNRQDKRLITPTLSNGQVLRA